MARDEEVDGEGKVAGGGKGEKVGEEVGEGKYAAQPSPYWLGRAFFEGSGLGRAGWDGSERGGRGKDPWGGICCQGPGNWDWCTS